MARDFNKVKRTAYDFFQNIGSGGGVTSKPIKIVTELPIEANEGDVVGIKNDDSTKVYQYANGNWNNLNGLDCSKSALITFDTSEFNSSSNNWQEVQMSLSKEDFEDYLENGMIFVVDSYATNGVVTRISDYGYDSNGKIICGFFRMYYDTEGKAKYENGKWYFRG